MRSKLLIVGVAAVAAFLLATNSLVAQAAAFITSADIVNDTIKSKDVKDNALKGKDVKNNSLKGADIDESSLGTVPSASSVGGLAASGVQDKASILFATIEPAGPGLVVKNSRGVVSAVYNNAGFYDVKFNRDVSGCTWSATYGRTAAGIDAKFATTRDASGANTADPTWMGVVLWDDAGAQVDGSASA
jgi:hypothetical protein